MSDNPEIAVLSAKGLCRWHPKHGLVGREESNAR